jgi:hypothetical protein
LANDSCGLEDSCSQASGNEDCSGKALTNEKGGNEDHGGKALIIRRAAMKTGAARAKTMPRKTLVVTTTALRPMDKGKGKFQQGDKQ